jgi:hypothetical protein
MSRTVVWFSAGAASAVAAKLTLHDTPDAVIARCLVTNEHEDNDRFALDCEKWFGKSIVTLWSDKYVDCWDVWEKRRWLNGPGGALCTVEMKKKVRQAYAQPDDINVFGFTVEEKARAQRFRMNNPEIEARFPLIERDITKRECFRTVERAGILLPAMYRLGYVNANCIGCVKGGMGYWNKIRRDFPAVFERMAALEEHIGASCINGQPLRTLDPNAGTGTDLTDLPDCGLFCGENEESFRIAAAALAADGEGK